MSEFPDLVINGLTATYLNRQVELTEAEMKKIAAVVLKAIKRAASGELKALKGKPS